MAYLHDLIEICRSHAVKFGCIGGWHSSKQSSHIFLTCTATCQQVRRLQFKCSAVQESIKKVLLNCTRVKSSNRIELLNCRFISGTVCKHSCTAVQESPQKAITVWNLESTCISLEPLIHYLQYAYSSLVVFGKHLLATPAMMKITPLLSRGVMTRLSCAPPSPKRAWGRPTWSKYMLSRLKDSSVTPCRASLLAYAQSAEKPCGRAKTGGYRHGMNMSLGLI